MNHNDTPPTPENTQATPEANLLEVLKNPPENTISEAEKARDEMADD